MHLIFEKPSGRFRSNCNILTLAWMPYCNESSFRQALSDYHQRQLLDLSSTPLNGFTETNGAPLGQFINSFAHSQSTSLKSSTQTINNHPSDEITNSHQTTKSFQVNRITTAADKQQLLTQEQKRKQEAFKRRLQLEISINSRLGEIYNRYHYLAQYQHCPIPGHKQNPCVKKSLSNRNDITRVPRDCTRASQELDYKYGFFNDFGWLVTGNIGRMVGITLTSIVPPPVEIASTKEENQHSVSPGTHLPESTQDTGPDLIQLQDQDTDDDGSNSINQNQSTKTWSHRTRSQDDKNEHIRRKSYDQLRPDRSSMRNNHNLRAHIDEVIIVKWNDLYQKLATVDGKGNVLIWCKVNDKFTIQTPFYNRSKSVADFQWSNDGKTALICYTDSFILVGSSSGQRHWHSMLNLEDYHITCGSWTPNDEQLLLGVSNGNIVLIDLPHSELTELGVSYANIRAMGWSNSNMNLVDIENLILKEALLDINGNPDEKDQEFGNEQLGDGNNNNHNNDSNNDMNPMKTSNFIEDFRRRGSSESHGAGGSRRSSNTTIVNQRRLSRDCSVFSRYRFCSQPPNNNHNAHNNNGRSLIRNNGNAKSPPFNSSMSAKQSCSNILAIDYANNSIELFEGGLDDSHPRTINVNLESYLMQWSSDGQILAVGGFNIHTMAPSVSCIRCQYLNVLKFYDRKARLIHERPLRYERYPITALTWAHNNQRLFVATGPRLHCAKVYFGVPKLSLLCMSIIHRHTKVANKIDVWKSITCGLYSLNTLDWQSKNCPINMAHIVREAAAAKRANDNFISLVRSQSNSAGATSSCYQNNNPLHLIGADMNGDCDEKIYPIYHNNSNIYVHHRLPPKLRMLIDSTICSQTIRQPFDACLSSSDIIWQVPKNNQRIYCTLVCYTGDRKLGPSAAYHYQNDWTDHQFHQMDSSMCSSDQFKVFVLYIEFAGFFVPILRARRVGILKPEFVIFDPHNKELSSSFRRQRKVSDVSSTMQSSNHKRAHRSNQATSSFGQDPCFGLHGSSTGSNNHNNRHLHSYSAEYDHNPMDKHHNHSCSTSTSTYTTPTRCSADKLVDLVQHRSHHQEPLAMPNSSHDAYLSYMMRSSNNNLESGSSTPLARSLRFGPVSEQRGQNNRLLTTNKHDNSNTIKFGSKGRTPHSTPSKTSTSTSTIIKRIRENYENPYLTEKHELIRIKSNIWGTKFRIINESNSMIKSRSIIGTLIYKASLLHLQPRQIFLNMKDMSNYCCLCCIHHHTNTGSSRIMMDSNQLTKKTGIMNNRYHEINLLNDSSSLPCTPTKTRRSTKNHDYTQKEIVILPFGDGLRISPARLSSTHRFSETCQFKTGSSLGHLVDPHLGANGSTRSKLECKDETVDLHKRLVSRQFSNRTTEHRRQASAFSKQDGILTLGLDSKNELKFDMKVGTTNSMRNITDKEAIDNNPTRSYQIHSTSTKRSSSVDRYERHQIQEQEAMASDKTLKSIKTITQMIVNLSEKAKEDDSSSSDNDEKPNPGKLIRSSHNDQIISPKRSQQRAPTSTSYVPPDTPVHRPRHQSPHNRIGKEPVVSKYKQLSAHDDSFNSTQSAHSTPIHNPRHRERQTAMFLNNDLDVESLVSKPLPKVPLSRRLSSSAKRFFDDSMRSLSLNTPTTYSHIKDQETKPLVSNSRDLIRRLQLTPTKKQFSVGSQLLDLDSSHQSATTSNANQYDLSYIIRKQISERFSISGLRGSNNQQRNSRRLDRDHRNRSSKPSRAMSVGAGGESPSPRSNRFNKRRNDAGNESPSLIGGLDSTEDDDSDDSYTSEAMSDLQLSHRKSAMKRYHSSGRLTECQSAIHQKKLATSNQIDFNQTRATATYRKRSICNHHNCCCSRELRLKNRPPLWNELSQVYQLDFGGRVTQESAKNLQIDYEGNLVSILETSYKSITIVM